MPELLTLQDLANGHLDVKALGEAANGDENTIVTTRTGNTYPSAERAINIMFQNGGLPAEPFPTKAKMETEGAALADGQLAQVYNETANNGLYVKTEGAWVKPAYSPLTTNKVKVSPNLLDLNALESGKNINTSGVIYSTGAYSLSPYIAVEPNTAYEMTSMVTAVFYDASKTYLSGATTKVFTTPENTAFIRVSNHTANMPNNMLTTVADRPPVFVAFKEVNYLYEVPLDLPQLSKELIKTFSVADVDENILPKIQNKVSTSVSNASFINRATNQLFDKTKITVDTKFGYGGAVSSSTTSNLTEYIAVKPNTVYSHAGEQGIIVEYDKDKLQTAWHGTGTASITTTATTAYVRIDVRTVALDKYVFFEGLPALAPTYPDYAVYDLSPTIRATTTKSKWEGKKWNYMGDSIVAASGNYCSKIAASKRMKVARNYGIGGTAIEVRDAPYDLNAMCIRYVDMDLDADLITVSGGTNGVKSAEGLGSFDVRDNTTTYGAVRDLMEGLVDRYPEATIAFILPFHRGSSHTHNQLYADSGIFAHRKILIDCCIYYGIPYFDSMTMLPLRLYNDKARTLYSPDGLHPNDAGHTKAAEIIGKWLETI